MTKNFSHLLKRLLKDRGWKTKDLEDKTGLDKSTLSRYVRGNRGRDVSHKKIKILANALGVSEDLFKIAQGQIPDEIYHTLCIKNPEATLTALRAIAAKSSKKPDQMVESLARDVLFRYWNSKKDREFQFPIDIKNLLIKVYGLNVIEESFARLEIPKPSKGKLCGILVPGHSQIGYGYFHNLVLLNSDVFNSYPNGRVVARFTMAHEAFHKEMWDLQQTIQSPGETDIEEVVYCRVQDISYNDPMMTESKANHFAGALLMPSKDVFKEVNQLPKPVDLNRFGDLLQSRYGVSRSALKVRLRLLGVSFIERDASFSKQLFLLK